ASRPVTARYPRVGLACSTALARHTRRITGGSRWRHTCAILALVVAYPSGRAVASRPRAAVAVVVDCVRLTALNTARAYRDEALTIGVRLPRTLLASLAVRSVLADPRIAGRGFVHHRRTVTSIAAILTSAITIVLLVRATHPAFAISANA